MDTSGNGGTVKHVIGLLDPSGCRITAFKAPTAEERAHPFLRRVEQALPARGELGIFDRSLPHSRAPLERAVPPSRTC
jgi:polyphosphate kinase 2 (PPK2 family)